MPTIEHVEVYREPGRFGGWPANYGIWAWGQEIVLGFVAGHMGGDVEKQFHLRDLNKPFTTMQARSLDGGKTWAVQEFPGDTPGNCALSADEHVNEPFKIETALKQPGCPHRPQPCTTPHDFTAPDFAFMAAKTGLLKGVHSFYYTTTDRCRSWNGPYTIPMFGLTGVAARTDIQVIGPQDALFFLTANKPDGVEGRTFCARTRDGGCTFEFVSHIGPEIRGDGWSIMPASLRLPGGRLLVARRCGEPVDPTGVKPWRRWIDLYASDDEGASWELLSVPAPVVGRNGNPPTLHHLADGRLVITYGYRDEPYRMLATLSADAGKTWGEPILLRDNIGAPDLGYPRTVVLDDGTIVTAYYMADEFAGGRYIAATRWTP